MDKSGQRMLNGCEAAFVFYIRWQPLSVGDQKIIRNFL
jgi:hypothetical protein